jgi:hypothetical protein
MPQCTRKFKSIFQISILVCLSYIFNCNLLIDLSSYNKGRPAYNVNTIKYYTCEMKAHNKLRTFYCSMVTARFPFSLVSSNHLCACERAEQLRPYLPPLQRTYTQRGKKWTAFCVWQSLNRTPVFGLSLIWCTLADL